MTSREFLAITSGHSNEFSHLYNGMCTKIEHGGNFFYYIQGGCGFFYYIHVKTQRIFGQNLRPNGYNFRIYTQEYTRQSKQIGLLFTKHSDPV